MLYPFFLGLFEKIFSKSAIIPDDLILNAAVAGLLIGFAIGIVARTGASTGGMDIPPLVINKLTGAPVGTTLLCFDVVIIATQLIKSDLIPIKATRTAAGVQIMQFPRKKGKVELATDNIDMIGEDAQKCRKLVIPSMGVAIAQLNFKF